MQALPAGRLLLAAAHTTHAAHTAAAHTAGAHAARTVATGAQTVHAAAHTAGAHVARTVATGAQSVSAGSLFLHLIIGLVVVLGLVALATKVVRRSTGLQARRQAPLAVLGRQSLGKGVSVAVVRAGDDTYLVGVSQHGVNRIARMAPEATAAFTVPTLRATQPAGAGRSLSLIGTKRRRLPPGAEPPASGGAGPRTAGPRTAGPAAASAAAASRPAGAAAPTWRSVVTSLQERTVRRA